MLVGKGRANVILDYQANAPMGCYRLVALESDFLYRFDGLGRSAPVQKLTFLRFERVGRPEESLQLLDRSRRQPPYVLQVAFEGRTTGHDKHTIVGLPLALR